MPEHIRRGIVKGRIHMIPVPVNLHGIPHVVQLVARDRTARDLQLAAEHVHRQRIALTDRRAAEHRRIGIILFIGQIILADLAEMIVQEQDLLRIRPFRIHQPGHAVNLRVEFINHRRDLILVVCIIHNNGRHSFLRIQHIGKAGIHIEPVRVRIQRVVVNIRDLVKGQPQRGYVKTLLQHRPRLPEHAAEGRLRRGFRRYGIRRQCRKEHHGGQHPGRHSADTSFHSEHLRESV